MKTDLSIEYELYDTTAQEDGTEYSDSNQTFGDLILLKEKRSVPSYGTLEQNFFVLDESKTEMPDAPSDIAYFSQEQGDSIGVFENEQSVYVTFTENHTSVGLTLYFEDVYPLEMVISWYDIHGILKAVKTYNPDSKIYFAQNQVEDYAAVRIVFTKVLPFHNVKLSYIAFGTTLVWESDMIKTGKLTEETDPISNTIKINKLNFELVDTQNLFDIGNPEGLHKTFQTNQKITPYEYINGEKTLLGIYYMDVNASSKNLTQITAFDMKGLLDNADFVDGKIYQGEPAGNIIDAIMETAGIADYEIDDEVRSVPLYGTLKIQTCRKALREVLFACGAVIDTDRRTNMYIRKYNRLVHSRVERERKFSTVLKVQEYVSDVNVSFKTWALASEQKEITKGTYQAGRHLVKLTNPASNMSINVGTIIKQAPYYIEFELENDSEVKITGQKWESTDISAEASLAHVKAGEKRSTKSFTGTLLDFNKAKEVAKNILDYYQLQQSVDIRYMGRNEASGAWIEVENPDTRHGDFVAGIEKLTTDLVGGFIQTAVCRGYYKLTEPDYYAGEIYAGEEVGGI